MHERRIFLDIAKSLVNEETLAIPEALQHYLFKVLRLQEGQEVVVGDSAYNLLPTNAEEQLYLKPQCFVCSIKDTKSLTIKSIHSLNNDLHPLICLAPALSKGDTNDIIVEKCVELGVAHIAIWRSERSIPILKNEEDIDRKIARWQKIATAAAQQAGRAFVPRVTFSNSIHVLLNKIEKVSKLRAFTLLQCSLKPDALTWHSLISQIQGKKQQEFMAIIGPEGDFSEEEDQQIRAIKALPLSLGPRRLKVDTAAISIVVLTDLLSSLASKDYD
jgi:16S rRNA (uracil1498-N3)-methyltransferase